MRNIKMIVQYDGSNFKGFQRLKDNDNTVQGKIEDVLCKLTDENVEIIGSGRTDMGVHAMGQVVNFKTNCNESVEKIQKYLYKYLPESIVIKSIEEVEDRFHSRYNAKSKVYLYKIDNNKFHNPFFRKYSAHINKKLNLDLMKEASTYLIGEHDFSSFASSKSKKKSNIRSIESIDIVEKDNMIEIYVKGDGFLYNMVRIIVGTLIDAGHRKLNPTDIKEILEAKGRKVAPETAPAKGLYLFKVQY
ncbi:tRNA pseudouridine(38-40) synthase TruA [Terrisporobacter mayombei]|uniref:tRNA pseudouridine synthase A n=1 Tax=Terrisporobacter mayombei TaxID=1541 RepID=A0ABY9PZR0_9FIRM|nr:tRNA pseudouridine(38-40) synthase TruA [Terrisporobacter mayombei]MCC3868586.1 tRNA pseudouridine(38-40) synthase TruA [Terrisporobacter mayombei]WMT80743.1 tRNA pseudouridine synthase A [Terrisporobacter mayombei]